MQTNVSIVGAGPAGFALAVDLQNHGKNVLLYSHPAHLQHAEAVQRKGFLQASGKMEGTTCLHMTTSMDEAIEYSNVIILTVPSTGQETVLGELARFDLRRHTIIAIPGNLFSLILDAEIETENVLEINLSPYSCRMEDGKLLVLGRKNVVFVAALRDTQSAFRNRIQDIFPMELRWSSSVIEVCLANVNGVFHPLMMLMNAGRIESTTGDFLLYRDGLTRSVANAMLAIDKVRMEIAATFGLSLRSALEVSNDCYGQDFTDLVDLAQYSPPHNRLKAPPSINNRNISEDVPDLLVCWHGLAEKVGLDSSPLAAVIILVEMATGMNYMRTGRNLHKLHLENVSCKELVGRFGVRSVVGFESRL